MASYGLYTQGYRPMWGGSIRLGHQNHFGMPRVINIENEYELDRHTMTAAGNRNLVVYYFYANWCKACAEVDSQFEALAQKYVDVIFMRINVDLLKRLFDNQVGHSFIRQESINTTPTFVFYRGGKRIGKVEGANMGFLENKISHEMLDTMF